MNYEDKAKPAKRRGRKPKVKKDAVNTGARETALMFLSAWQNGDWDTMAELTQITWHESHHGIKPREWIRYNYKHRQPESYKIINEYNISESCVKITAEVKRSEYTIMINMMVICEKAPFRPDPQGTWGVNPISAFRDIYAGGPDAS